jgi:hypothetical protein
MDNPIHLMRWLKAQAVGGSEEAAARAVAASEGRSIDVVRQSIRMVAAFRARNDKANFDYAMRDLLTSTASTAKESLAGLLTAMELVETTDAKTGAKKVIRVEDKTTRLEAIRVFNSLLGNLQPKVPLVNNEINQTNQTAVLSGGAGAAETTEERLRRLRKAAAEHRLLPPQVVGVPQHIDEETDPDDDEDEEDGEEVDE